MSFCYGLIFIIAATHSTNEGSLNESMFTGIRKKSCKDGAGNLQFLNRRERGNQSSIHVTLEYDFCLDHQRTGNRFGDLYNAVGCAAIGGVDLVINSPNFHDDPFLRGFPQYFRSPNRLPYMKAIEIMKQRCVRCKEYCFENSYSPWINALPIMKVHMQRAAYRYRNKHDQTILNITTDISSVVFNGILPTVPNVTIHYRCGDNIEHSSSTYGFIPYHIILRLVPAHQKFIYILSDPPERSASNPFNKNCAMIIKELFDYTVKKHPKSTVVAKRGGDLFLDFTRLILSPITICSASTFCFWPSLANENVVYLPLSKLFGGAVSMNTAPHLGNNVHFFDGRLISSFKERTPIHDVLRILKTKRI